MKKVALLSLLVASCFASQAQYTLSGSSPYSQDFNSIGGGLPTGWGVYSGSSAASIGTFETFSTSTSYGRYNDTTCGTSDVVGGGFKNYPSANAATAGTSCSAQLTISDRAMGVRQVSPTNASHPNLDSGAAFVFQISNTAGITNLGASFKLQSLDTSSPRVTTWKLQYKIGTGAWTDQTVTGAMTTGGHAFSNTPITASFGSALDNKSSNVYLRIVTLDFSSGTGNRPSTAIDDFSLTWSGRAAVSDVAANGTLPFGVAGTPSSSNVTFSFDAEDAGDFSLVITDLAGRKVYSQNVAAVRGNQTVTANGLSLAPGMYIARLSNGAAAGVTKVVIQ